jgi:hypothetical protein
VSHAVGFNAGASGFFRWSSHGSVNRGSTKVTLNYSAYIVEVRATAALGADGALDSVAEMVLSYHVAKREAANAHEFIRDLSRRIDGRFQLTTEFSIRALPCQRAISHRANYMLDEGR